MISGRKFRATANTRDNGVFTLPTLSTGNSSDGQSIVVKDETAIAEIAEALDTDDMAGYLAGYLAANNGGL